MATIIKFPPDICCPVCQINLRPATSNEIRDGLRSSDSIIRQSFAHAVQGDMEKKFIINYKFTTVLEPETPEGTWVMLCDRCGHISVTIHEENPC